MVFVHVCHVRDDMVIPLSLSFVSFGELGRVLEIFYELFSQVIGLCVVYVIKTTWTHFFEML